MGLCIFACVTVMMAEVYILAAAGGCILLFSLLFMLRSSCGVKTDPNYYDAIHSPGRGSPFPDDERNPLLEVQRSAGGLNQVGGGLVL